ncbi:MAG: right-handed parallel beta-helix repeat-containing protein [Lewinellaceae bacterium]|nr:right-handed parallel beta-helix repeat-containing protein [Lewinellaceae bacterium]
MGFVHAQWLSAQALPELPQTAGLITCFPDTTGYQVLTVGPVGRDYSNLQSAISAASPGTILVLDAGAVFEGSFTLPYKQGEGWIILMSSATAVLPTQETRIQPNAPTGNGQYPLQKDAMPKIVTTNTSGVPCFRTLAAAHHYRLVGLEITASLSVSTSYGLVFFGDASSAQNTLAAVPHDLIIDRCYVHGHTNATIMKSGVLLNCAAGAVVDSYVSDFHSIGYDTYAIGGTNGPGPFKILNNYLEAAGENILFGGAAPAVQGLVPSDIEIRNNHFYKPFSWRVGHPDYAGKHWTVKNLFELKTGRRVLLEGNVMENVWADLPIGQSGYAILLTVRTESGNAPQADVRDVTIRNNIIRHAGAGISLSGHDSPGPSMQSSRILVANNLFDDISGPSYGDGNVNGPNDGTFLKIGDPRDVTIEHNTVFQTGPITWAYDTVEDIRFTNNIFNCFLSAGNYQGIYGPGFAQGGNGPMGAYFPGIPDAGQGFHKNVLIGGNASKYSNYSTASQNFFPSNPTEVQFADFANGSPDFQGFALSPGSPFWLAATDGTDIGADMADLAAALVAVPQCNPSSNVFSSGEKMRFNAYPNPVQEQLSLVFPERLVNAVVILSDLYGRQARSWANQQGNSLNLQIDDLPSGMYVCAVWQYGRLLGSVLVLVA